MKLRVFAYAAVFAIAGCAHHSQSFLPSPSGMTTPQSVSPALIKPAPMAQTAIQPSSAMSSRPKPDLAISGLGYTQLSGTATVIAGSPDGSLWALSNLPNGPDKYIWHYASGTWTNIAGLADAIAVAPDGTLYAVNSGGGVYKYNSNTGTYTALGGGATAITVGFDGSPYVTTNGAGTDKAIWEYCCSPSPIWGQIAGSGTYLAGTWDSSGPYSINGGTINDGQGASGGLYILNSAGGIYYENDMHSAFVNIPGAASAIVPTINGGLFVLGAPSNPSGNNIYYYDLNAGTFVQQPGAGVGITAGYSNIGGMTLYVLSASGGIYQTAVSPISVLTGGTTSATFTGASGGTLNISPADNTYSGSASLGSSNAGANFTATMAWGTFAQVSGNFPAGALPGSIGTALLYLDLRSSYVNPTTSGNNGSFSVTFGQTPAVTVTTSGSFPGTHCGWAAYANPGSGSKQWVSMTALGVPEVTPSGNTYTVPAQTSTSQIQFWAGSPQYLALYCH